MLKTLVLTTAIAITAVSGAAFASTTNAGDVQLAKEAGVAPGKYSTTELISILDAKRSGDAQALAYYLSGADRAPITENAGTEQLARQLGVAPGQYSLQELIAISDAKRDNDASAVAYYVNHENRDHTGPALANAGAVQLAKLVGVDPATHTVAQVVALQPVSDN
ncbi:MAG: hypothetical protein EBU97_03215 [Rhodobacteraceae bacterium]|nr:hypothetical protein [Paracoccaceae bacterium]